MLVKFREWAEVLFVGSAVWCGVTFGGEAVPTYGEVRESVEKSYAVRGELLGGSRGKAKVVLERYEFVGDKGADERRGRKGEGIWGEFEAASEMRYSADWQRAGAKSRFDLDVVETRYAPYVNGEATRQVERYRVRGTADGKEVFRFSPDEGRVVIEALPAGRVGGWGYTVQNFSVEKFYRISGLYTVGEMFAEFEAAGAEGVISREEVGGRDCVKAVFEVEGEGKRGERYEMWFSESEGYSLVRMLWYRSGDGGYEIVRSFEAEYGEARNGAGVYVLKRVVQEDVTERGGPGRGWKVSASFKDVEVGVDVGEEVFTLAGLRVPEGTGVYRKVEGWVEEFLYSYEGK